MGGFVLFSGAAASQRVCCVFARSLSPTLWFIIAIRLLFFIRGKKYWLVKLLFVINIKIGCLHAVIPSLAGCIK
jgi:hypothetical protein